MKKLAKETHKETVNTFLLKFGRIHVIRAKESTPLSW